MEKKCLFLPKISSYLDKELSEAERLEMEAHLRACAECKGELESMQGLDRLIQELPEVEPGPGFDSAFWKKVDALEYSRPARKGLFAAKWPSLLAAAAVVMIGIGSILYHSLLPKAPSIQEIQLATNMELLRELELIENLDFLEHMDELMMMGSS